MLRSLFAVLCLLTAPAVFALDPHRRISQYVHDVWTTSEGLPQDSINDIVQTPDGYLWVATQEGLARFDGVTFTSFDTRNTRAIQSDFVHALFVDRKGTLWAGDGDGLLRYDGGSGFTAFGLREGFVGSAAKYISEDRAGNLWIGMGTGRTRGGKGLIRFKDGRVTRFTTANGLPSDQVYGTCTDHEGTLWIGTGNGLAVLRNNRIEPVLLPATLVRTVYEDRAHVLWIGTPNGLMRYDRARLTTFTTGDGLLADDIESIYEDRDGALWIATSKGVNRIVNGRIESAPIERLGEDRIFALFEDREGSLWIGTHASGLHRLRAGKLTPFGPAEGMAGQSVNGIYEDRDGALWMGTSPGGVNVLRDGSFTTYTATSGFPTNNAKAFTRDRRGMLWIGTTDGLVRFDGTSFALVLPQQSVNTIREDRQGTLWIGSNSGLYRRAGEQFEHVPLPESAPEEIRVVHELRNGRLFLGGGDGAGYLDGDRYVALAVPGNVMAVHEDADGTLWLATWGSGLFRVQDRNVMRYTTARGLFDNTLWSILDDGRGNFWMGSNRGIFRVPRRQIQAGRRLTCVVYGRDDGMRRRETNSGSPAAIRARDGRLWFATTGGAVVIDPANIPLNRLAPNVVIQHFVANEEEVHLHAPLVLEPGTRSLEVHYAALSLTAPSRLHYRYRLEGFDDHWIDAGTRRSAYYTNVDPGSYTFRVIAANDDGVWNHEGATVTIHLRPYFYQTWWFYLGAAVALFLLVLAFRAVKSYSAELRHRMYHDPLTGLPNRALLSERAAVALSQAERRSRSIAILFLDLDGFKGVNDRYGHAAGDQLLQLVADRLRACIREIDTLARIGGDEFAALIADLEDESRAADVAQRMIDALRPEFVVGGTALKLGVSIGIAFHPFDGADVDSILQAADRAMYRAKLAGGNQYQYNAADRDEVLMI